jgi:SAM-dependent methyltransferase
MNPSSIREVSATSHHEDVKTPEISPMAVPGAHEAVIRAFECAVPPVNAPRVLDIGAGHGALTQRLVSSGYSASACDLYPELFQLAGVECRKVDANGRLPYDDATFDGALAIELLEHIEGHESFFSEAARILKPGGRLLFSTPNVLSFKSRWQFFWTGYFYSFCPLDPKRCDPVTQHISPFTIDRYRWRLAQSGLEIVRVTTDKQQTTSLLFSALYPVARLAARLKFGASPNTDLQNSAVALFGRKIIIEAVRHIS